MKPSLLRLLRTLAPLVPLVGLMVACSVAPSADEQLCTPRANVFCRCTDRSEGTKKCSSDGTSFGECKCSASGVDTDGDTDGDDARREDDLTDGEDDDRPPPTTPPPATTPPPSTTSPDAGAPVDSGPPPIGPSCTKLQGCCSELEKQGYSPSTCLGVVDARNEQGCHSTHLNYKNFGDCS